jgi:SAM-dependent methyltransferase
LTDEGRVEMNKKNILNEYERYWENKKDSRHSIRPDIDFFRLAAREILVFYHPDHHNRILEIGCGAGEVFQYYEFDNKKYLGIDFSESMLNEFRKRNPGVKVKHGRGDSFYTPMEFDFIFSNNVIQHFSPTMVRNHIKSMAKMLSRHGRLIIGGIPNVQFREQYERGIFHGYSLNFLQYLTKKGKRFFKNMFGHSKPGYGIGYWYGANEFKEWGKLNSLDMHSFGCMIYPYRFHIMYTWKKM